MTRTPWWKRWLRPSPSPTALHRRDRRTADRPLTVVRLEERIVLDASGAVTGEVVDSEQDAGTEACTDAAADGHSTGDAVQDVAQVIDALNAGAQVEDTVLIKSLGTGFDDETGIRLPDGVPDPDYAIVGGTAGAAGSETIARVGPIPGTWIADDASNASRWLVFPSSDPTTAAPGTFVFETTVDVTGFDPDTVSIHDLQYGADNKLLNVWVNDTVVFSQDDGFAEEFLQFQVIGDVGLGEFEEGVNTIRFEVSNSFARFSPMGLRVEGTVEGVLVPATEVSVDEAGNVVVQDLLGVDDRIAMTIEDGALVVRSESGAMFAGASTEQVGTSEVRIALEDIGPDGRIVVHGGEGDDNLSVHTDLVAAGLVVDYFGGGQNAETAGDALTIGGSATTLEHVFVNENDGHVSVDGFEFVNYVGLEPITDNVDVVNRIFTFDAAAETITLTDGLASDGRMRIDSTSGEFVEFDNPTGSLTIVAGTTFGGGTGADEVFIDSVDDTFTAAFTVTSLDPASIARVEVSDDLVLGSPASTGNVSITAAAIRIDGTIDTRNGLDGAITLVSTGGVLIDPNAVLQTDTGAITVFAADGGIRFRDNSRVETVTGRMTLTGFGADTGNVTGVLFDRDVRIASTGTGNDVGPITIVGVGGTLNGGAGVFGDFLFPVTVSSVDADIVLRGAGGANGGEGVGIGINLESAGVGATAGNITVVGTSGAAGGSGVRVTSIETIDGDVLVEGIGGPGENGFGVSIPGTVASRGEGTISIRGIGGTGSGQLEPNHGVVVRSSAIGAFVGVGVVGTDGDVLIEGIGGEEATAVFFADSGGTGSKVVSTGLADIVVRGTNSDTSVANSDTSVANAVEFERRSGIETQSGDVRVEAVNAGLHFAGTASASGVGTLTFVAADNVDLVTAIDPLNPTTPAPSIAFPNGTVSITAGERIRFFASGADPATDSPLDPTSPANSRAVVQSSTGIISNTPARIDDVVIPPIGIDGVLTFTMSIGRVGETNLLVTVDWSDGTTSTQFVAVGGTEVTFTHDYSGDPRLNDPTATIPLLVDVLPATNAAGVTTLLLDAGVTETVFIDVAIDGVPAGFSELAAPDGAWIDLEIGAVPTFSLVGVQMRDTSAAIGLFVDSGGTDPAFPESTIYFDAINGRNAFEQRNAAELLGATTDAVEAEERQVILHVLTKQGTVRKVVILPETVLDDLPAYYTTLPDGGYRIYVREPGDTRLRLVDQVVIRGGKIDDGSAGLRERAKSGSGRAPEQRAPDDADAPKNEGEPDEATDEDVSLESEGERNRPRGRIARRMLAGLQAAHTAKAATAP